MYLSNLIIINYRSCKLIEVDLLNSEPNIFIGVNDCGKTSILKAIGLLLDDKPSYFSIKENSSKKDFSNSPLSKTEFNELLEKYEFPDFNYSENQTIVIGKLVIEEHDINEVASQYSNQLLWAIENSPEHIWLIKSYESNQALVTSAILVPDSIEGESSLQLWNKTAADLTKRIKDLSISSEEIENVNKRGRFSNLEKVRAIYSKLTIENIWSDYKIEKADKNLFPIFRYLDWNCSLEDIKKTAADAMATKIEAHVLPLRKQASEAAAAVEIEINDQLRSLKDSIGDMIPNITGIKTKIFFDVKESVTDILINKINGDGDIHLDLQGEGVKRQIWFALIKSGAMASIQSGMTNTKFIWAFDEPETHLYPTAQRQFFDIIKDVSQTNVQTLISTHSTIFIDKSKLKTIKSVSLKASAYSEFNDCTSVDEVFEALELRNSDFLFYDKFLVIEGDTEQYLIPELYTLYTGSSLKDDNIQLINLTGKNKWLEGKKALENVLKDFKKSSDYVVYLFDADMKKELGENGITDKFFFAGKQDIEDSISTNVWVDVVAEKTDNKITLLSQDIDNIKDIIPANEVIPSNQKFFRLLEKLVKEKLTEFDGEQVTWDVLSSKGNESARDLLNKIKSIEEVSPEIKKAFDKLRD